MVREVKFLSLQGIVKISLHEKATTLAYDVEAPQVKRARNTKVSIPDSDKELYIQPDTDLNGSTK